MISSPPDTHTLSDLAQLATVSRSGLIESRHFGSLAAFNTAGERVVDLGQTDAPILPRSTVKPAQAVACLTAGAPLAGPELAIAAGSHTGEDAHVRTVRAILDKAGLDEDALQCPPDRPEDEATFTTLLGQEQPRARIRMNCSGKHAAMLLACAVNGWPTDTYLDPEHPLQKQVRATVAELSGGPVRHDAIDGCGAPLFGTTVQGMATVFRRLVLAHADSAAGQVAAAMRAHPFYVGGSGHANSEVMKKVPGALAKGGAEGVIGIATGEGAAVSMKIIDGSPRATTVVGLHVLAALGADVSNAAALMHADILGGGVPVGEIAVSDEVQEALARVDRT